MTCNNELFHPFLAATTQPGHQATPRRSHGPGLSRTEGEANAPDQETAAALSKRASSSADQFCSFDFYEHALQQISTTRTLNLACQVCFIDTCNTCGYVFALPPGHETPEEREERRDFTNYFGKGGGMFRDGDLRNRALPPGNSYEGGEEAPDLPNLAT